MFRKFTLAKRPDKQCGYGRFLGLSLIWGFLSIGAIARAEPRLYTIYRYNIAATGSCMKSISSDPRAVLRRNGITYNGTPSSAELVALAKGIGQLESLLGEPLPQTWRTPYNYINSSDGRWNQGAAAINVRCPKGSTAGQNIGRLMHELGHKVGNVGGGRIYSEYQSYTRGKDCKITGYAGTKNNEEFAEVFSAYVTYPDLLRQTCAKAFEFMSKKLFPNSQSALATCRVRPATTLAQGEARPEGDTATRNRVIPKPRLERVSDTRAQGVQ